MCFISQMTPPNPPLLAGLISLIATAASTSPASDGRVQRRLFK
jgi:hypothetical protein